MRILHVTPYGPQAWAYGGVPRVMAALAREQRRRGHQVTICATDAMTATSRCPSAAAGLRWLPHPGVLDAYGVDLRLFPNLSNRLAYDWQAFIPVGLSAYLAAHAHEFDVAHLHACRNLPGVIAARHLRRAGVPYVLAPNGTAPRLERRFLAKRVFDVVAGRRVLTGAAAIIAVSDAERRQLAALGVPPSRVRLVPNPVALDEFAAPPPRGSFRQAYDLGSAPVVLFLGKLTPRKHVDVLIRAFAALGRRDAKLVIAGNDMGSAAGARTLVRELGLGSRTLFTGLLSGVDRLRALADATVVVYPSADEVFGLVPLEALLSGTPVIVSDDSGCGEVIGRVGGGLAVPPRDVEALAAAIGQVLDHHERWLPEVARAGAPIRDHFSPGAVVDALDDVYGNVLGRSTAPTGVSFVVPVRRGAPWLRATLEAIWADQEGWPFEIIVVDDGVRGDGDDGSMTIARAVANGRPFKIVPGSGRGAAAALNAGFRAARFPIVCQVDQDVTIRSGWTRKLVAALADPRIAAAQGRYIVNPAARVGARVMATDLEFRYDALGTATDHVCTGNTAYRADAVHAAGLFDEALGYGYDNDLSYRLRSAGHRLAFVREATSLHHWRDSFPAYLRQQYGFGYGRLDVVAKHPTRAGGDDVSGAVMMLHPVALATGLMLLGVAAVLALSRGPAAEVALAGATIVAALVVERAAAGLVAWRRFGDRSALLFPVWHLARDLAWVAAMVVWTGRRAIGSSSQPSHSMTARPDQSGRPPGDPRVELPNHPAAPTRIIGIIPAHNERTALASILGETRAHHPDLDLLVVDDGSTDGTSWLLDELGATYVRLPERMGVGSAMRAGLGYATRLGYDAAVRLDGDGQHRPEDIDRLLGPLLGQQADVVTGSRYDAGVFEGRFSVRLIQRLLAVCISAATGTRVTDPTSGYCAIGPRAIRLLADHHPTGYPEPELHLFLSRNGLTAVEVPVRARARLAGRSSLTPFRLARAGARVLLALVTVPFRRAVVFRSRD